MKIANMSTFPARKFSTLLDSVTSIARQVDVVNVCFNEFDSIPGIFAKYSNVNAILPEKDYKDVGKFIGKKPDSDDDVYLVDDDIIYPSEYTDYCKDIRHEFKELNPIVGFHGVIYADVFNGAQISRNVFSFRTGLTKNRVVNQLGTGTVYCKGYQVPSLEFMSNSEYFSDARFARYAFENNWPMICGARETNWMLDISDDDSIFNNFTQNWPSQVTREVQSFAGYSKLSLDVIRMVEIQGSMAA